MILAICLTALVLIACAVTIYRLSGEKEELVRMVKNRDVDLGYLRGRNTILNGELLTMSRKYGMPPNTQTASTSQPVAVTALPAEHPQKRRPKSIRAKRKP